MMDCGREKGQMKVPHMIIVSVFVLHIHYLRPYPALLYYSILVCFHLLGSEYGANERD